MVGTPEYEEARAFVQGMVDLTQTPFSELPEEAKDEDRLLARKAIEVFTHVGDRLPKGAKT